MVPLNHAVPAWACSVVHNVMLLQTSGLIEPRIHITNGSRPTRDVDVRYIITRVSRLPTFCLVNDLMGRVAQRPEGLIAAGMAEPLELISSLGCSRNFVRPGMLCIGAA